MLYTFNTYIKNAYRIYSRSCRGKLSAYISELSGATYTIHPILTYDENEKTENKKHVSPKQNERMSGYKRLLLHHVYIVVLKVC